jgi:O-antigen ligase
MRARDRISLALGAAALLVSVLVIGGVLRWTQAVVAALVALALVVQLGSRRRLDHVSPVVVLFGIAIALTAIQLLPLPDRLLDALNASGSQLRRDGAELAGTAPWRAISLDPAGTLRGLAYLITLFGVGLLGLRAACFERGRYFVLAAVAVTCGLAAAVTGLHTLFHAAKLYGIYEPQHAAPPILGPLLNANHLGGLMALGAVVAVGLALYTRQAAQLRVLWVVIAAGCSATALASLSRGATLGLGVGLVTLIALSIAGRLSPETGGPMRHQRALIHEVPITIVIAFGLAVAVYTSAGKVVDQLDNTSLVELHQPISKYAAWRSALELVNDAPWVGVGRGAVEPAFTRVYEPSAYFTFSHLENEYVQVLVEWGVPGAILIGLALAWCIVSAVKRWRDGPLAAAAIGACAALVFQSSVDFGVELLGVSVPALLVATTLLGGRLREARSIGVTGGRLALVAALAGAAVVLVLPVTRSLQEDHDWLNAGDAATLADVHQVIERHPLDYLGFGEAATLMLQSGDPRAARLLNHALRLHPSHPGLHRLAARMFIASGRRSQGAVEYALALRGTLAPRNLIGEIVTLLPDAQLAAAAIPTERVNPQHILRALSALDRDDIAERWLQRMVLGPQRDLAMFDELYRLALARRDLPAAEQAARLRLAESHTNASRILLARVMFKRESFDQVLKDLADVPSWKGRIDEQAEAWLLMCDAQIEKRAWDPALECLHKLDGAGLIEASRRFEIVKRFTIVNDHRAAEAKQRAIEDMERALGSRPKSP